MTFNQWNIVAAACAALIVGAFITWTLIDAALYDGDHATIAGTQVPAVRCAEDEVIWWTAIDTLGCVHYEEVN